MPHVKCTTVYASLEAADGRESSLELAVYSTTAFDTVDVSALAYFVRSLMGRNALRHAVNRLWRHGGHAQSFVWLVAQEHTNSRSASGV